MFAAVIKSRVMAGLVANAQTHDVACRENRTRLRGLMRKQAAGFAANAIFRDPEKIQ
jgi:hypothetical protein